MSWIGIGVAFALLLGIAVRMLTHRATHDLGAVSTNWIAQHRDLP
jgi:hypothetical protein